MLIYVSICSQKQYIVVWNTYCSLFYYQIEVATTWSAILHANKRECVYINLHIKSCGQLENDLPQVFISGVNNSRLYSIEGDKYAIVSQAHPVNNSTSLLTCIFSRSKKNENANINQNRLRLNHRFGIVFLSNGFEIIQS